MWIQKSKFSVKEKYKTKLFDSLNLITVDYYQVNFRKMGTGKIMTFQSCNKFNKHFKETCETLKYGVENKWIENKYMVQKSKLNVKNVQNFVDQKIFELNDWT